MYGGSAKLGRGGGAGAGRGTGAKRLPSSFPLPPPHRPSGPGSAGASRLSLGGRGSGSASNPRNRASGPAAAPAAAEETFSLVAGNNPLAFAMIIRLAPDLVDEIRRLEAQDGTARIKFDANANNSAGNVIDVGGKEFRFTWSREFGDLCDIYEERQSGEDGNGLLVESGSAWRKLNVQRVLDESTKNHVKMMSEEAERKLKSRKAIVLDHGNPSMKSQLKALAAVETNPWRHYKQKKEPAFKKRKVEPPQVTGPPKSVHKSGISSTTTPTKGRHSSSPLPSPPEQSVHPASPLGNVNIPKSNATVEDLLPTQGMSKENTATSSEKEIPTLTTGAVRKRNAGAVGDTIPNSGRKIEPVTKKSSNFQASGRNITKPGVELETLKKPLSESGSSPEDNHHQRPVAEDKNGQTPAAEPIFNEKSTTDELEEPTHLNSKLGEDANALEKIDIQEHSPNLFGEKKGSENSEGQVGSTSDSGSDSDSESDSSDSASDSGSRSRSRSRSIVGSGSGSSSDSESDASSNSKQGSDEDVDIMTSDDDKEPQHKLQPSETGFASSPVSWRTPDIKPVHSGNSGKQDGQGSYAIEIEKDFPDDEQETELAAVTSLVPDKEGEKCVEETKPFSPDHDDLRERQNYAGSLFDEGNNTLKHSVRHEQSDSSERISMGKLKRSSDVKHFKEKVERTKRTRVEAQHSVSGGWDSQLPESSHNLSPDGLDGNPYLGSTIPGTKRTDRDGNTDIGLKKGYNQMVPGKSSSDIQQSGRRSFDQSTRAKAPDTADRPEKHEGLGRGHKYSEKSFNVHEGLSMQKENLHRDSSNEADYAYAKKVSKNSRGGGAGGKQSVSIDSHYRKHGEMLGKSQEGGQFSSTLMGSSPKDNARAGVDVSPVFNGKGSILQRELSDLELGELREPLPEETPIKKKFERKSSFKQSENKPGSTENWNSDLSKAKSVGKATSESGKPSPPNLNANQDGSNKKRNTEDRTEDLRRSNHRVVQSQPQHVSKVDRVEIGSKPNKLSDGSNKSRQNESKASQGIGLESYQSYSESNKKAPVTAPQQLDAKRGLVSPSTVETRTQISNAAVELTDGKRDSNWGEGNNSDRKRRDSSSDENSCSYSKYEKDEPELKGPIRDFSQYKEYVQEYRDKYDTYCSLDKILETYRNEFHKLGKDLDSAKDRDMEKYYYLLGQLKESYHQCGTRHKRLKKIFVVLHEELKNLKQKIKDFALSYTKD